SPLKVKQPVITTIPQKIKSLRRQITSFNDSRFTQAISRSASDVTYTCAYAHFFPSAIAALPVLTKKQVPLFLNLGESDPWDYDLYCNKEQWVRDLERFAGIITVSRRNYDYVLQRNPALEEKVIYIPNGV